MIAVIHPGFDNEYVFTAETSEEAWAKMREHLQTYHGGLWGGMLANCREVIVSTPSGAEDMGRCWNATPVRLNEQGAVWVWSDDADEETRAIAYYTDEAGSAVLLVLDW